jgi:hypothetical protein
MSRTLPPLYYLALSEQGQLYHYLYRLSVDWDRAISIGTRYGLDGPEIEFQWVRDFPRTFRPAQGFTQPPTQFAPDHSRG